MNRKNKITLTIVIVIILGLFLTCIYIYNSKLNLTTKENIQNKEQFALMVFDKEQDNYVSYNGDIFDAYREGHYLNIEKSKCLDNNNNLLDTKSIISVNDGKITITSNKSAYCTLYFDDSIVKFLWEKDETDTLSHSIGGNMFRYQGLYSNVNVNNYICLESNNCSSSLDDMYRIIGVNLEGEIKIIKQTSIGTYQWWTENKYDSKNDIDWEHSLIYQTLNTNSDSFVNSLSESIQELIEPKEWYYGDMHSFFSDILPEDLYQIEIGQKEASWLGADYSTTQKEITGKWNKKTTAKIGLMQLQDYAFSAGNDKNSCFRGRSSITSCPLSWIHNTFNENSASEWMMIRDGLNSGGSSYNAWRIDVDGIASGKGLNEQFAVRPVFYLSNTIQLSGSGTNEDPFIINN